MRRDSANFSSSGRSAPGKHAKHRARDQRDWKEYSSMISGENNPADELKKRGIRIREKNNREQVERRAVTDLITQNLCARHAHFFGEGQYPTPCRVLCKGNLCLIWHTSLQNVWLA